MGGSFGFSARFMGGGIELVLAGNREEGVLLVDPEASWLRGSRFGIKLNRPLGDDGIDTDVLDLPNLSVIVERS